MRVLTFWANDGSIYTESPNSFYFFYFMDFHEWIFFHDECNDNLPSLQQIQSFSSIVTIFETDGSTKNNFGRRTQKMDECNGRLTSFNCKMWTIPGLMVQAQTELAIRLRHLHTFYLRKKEESRAKITFARNKCNRKSRMNAQEAQTIELCTKRAI